MMNKKEFLKSQQECADMLGITLKEYNKDCKNTKISLRRTRRKKYKYDNSILEKLGLTSKDLLGRRI